MNILSNIKECLINKVEYITYIGHPYVFARHVVGRFGLDHAHTPALEILNVLIYLPTVTFLRLSYTRQTIIFINLSW